MGSFLRVPHPSVSNGREMTVTLFVQGGRNPSLNGKLDKDGYIVVGLIFHCKPCHVRLDALRAD